jgi:hypothetical protein
MPTNVEEKKDPNRLVMLAYPRPGVGYTKESAPAKCVLRNGGQPFEIPLGGFSPPIPYRVAKYHIGSMRFWGPEGRGGNGILLEIREIVAGQAAPVENGKGANDFDVNTASYQELVVKAQSLGYVNDKGKSKEELKALILAKSQPA